ncbi:MAG: S-layer homology domain-containing protein [Bacillota bacterium]
MIYAEESVVITLSKQAYTLREKGIVTISGLSESAIEEGAWIAIEKVGTKHENSTIEAYVSDFDAQSSYEFTAPREFGEYELRVYHYDYTVIGIIKFSVVPSAAGKDDITISKSKPRLKEKMSAVISGLTAEEINEGVWIAVEKEGTKPDNYTVAQYISDLPADNKFEFDAPCEFGKYELIVLYPDYTKYGTVKFEVVPGVAAEADIVLSKYEVKLGEDMKATIKGLIKEEIDEGVWIGVEPEGTKLENTALSQYISDLDKENEWDFKAPTQFGKYELRVIYPDAKTIYGTESFSVVSSKAEAGDLVLSPASAAPGEKMKFTVKGLTKGEIEQGAWIGLAKADAKLENTALEAYISELPIGDTYEFDAPMEAGTYELRVFCSSSLLPEQMEYAMFGKVAFTVSGAPVDEEIVAGYEGLSGWAVNEVIEARDNGLVTDTVMQDFTKTITRAEFCELVVRLYERMSGKTAEPVEKNPFTDTDNPEILKAFNLGIVNGVDLQKGIFAPDSFVTREQISAMFVRALTKIMPELNIKDADFTQKFYDEDEISSWAYDSLKFLNHNGIFGGSSGYILPKANTTREQAIALVRRIFDKFFQI